MCFVFFYSATSCRYSNKCLRAFIKVERKVEIFVETKQSPLEMQKVSSITSVEVAEIHTHIKQLNGLFVCGVFQFV